MSKRHAIGRRRITQVRFVLKGDPAIDYETMTKPKSDEEKARPVSDYEAYKQSQYTSMDKLKFKGEPVVFHLRPLTGRQKEVCYSFDGVHQNNTIARCAIQKIVGFDGMRELVFKESGSLGVIVGEDWWYDNDYFTSDEVGEIVVAVLEISEAKRPLS